jgi:hypothetical protein
VKNRFQSLPFIKCNLQRYIAGVVSERDYLKKIVMKVGLYKLNSVGPIA